jgi:hypothetical protein
MTSPSETAFLTISYPNPITGLITPVNIKFTYTSHPVTIDGKRDILGWYELNGTEIPMGINDIKGLYDITNSKVIRTMWLDPQTLNSVFGTYNGNTIDRYSISINGSMANIIAGGKHSIVIEQTISLYCFNKGTKILCLTKLLTEEYRLVQDLMVGDLVKVYNNEPKRIKVKIQGSFINNPNNPKKCMYVMKKTEDNELIDDLIVTGLHGILLDEPDERNPKWANFKVDDKYNVIASISNKFEQIKNNELYNYYHFSLDNGTERKRLGVWANGVLMETLSSNK